MRGKKIENMKFKECPAENRNLYINIRKLLFEAADIKLFQPRECVPQVIVKVSKAGNCSRG